MSEHPTLREISGLPATPPGLRGSALVMIDCQNTYRTGLMALEGAEPALLEAQKLLARAREAGSKIIHIRHDAGPGSPYDVTAELGQIADIVAPLPGETLITKSYPNSFVATDLDAQLKAAGIETLILAGFMTHMCVNSTARGAFNLGYRAAVVAAATATRALPGADGTMVPAASVHAASLAAIADLFAVVVAGSGEISV